MSDLISRQEALEAIQDAHHHVEVMSMMDNGRLSGLGQASNIVRDLPSVCADCIKHGGDWECDHVNCHKGTKQQATKASDYINRQDAIRSITGYIGTVDKSVAKRLLIEMPSVESVKAYTKADYIMALHKEYGCTLTMAEEAHNKALEHLRSKARMKG